MTSPETCLLPLDTPPIRIDLFLSQKYPHLSRTYFQELLEKGLVLVNGQVAKKRHLVQGNDTLSFFLEKREPPTCTPENIPLHILYEDPHLLAIDKPPGMVVHPATGNWTGTFANALAAHCQDPLPGADTLRPGIVHRLDKDTSGVLLAAKTEQAHQALIASFAAREVEKIYLAVCFGKPPNGPCNAPIGRDPHNRKQMAVVETGKEALTHVEVLSYNAHYSLVLLRPKTGRTHQLRVHLSHLQCPIVGDPLYTKRKGTLSPRILLHAKSLTLPHPIHKTPLTLQAPLPQDLSEWIEKNLSQRKGEIS